MRRQVSEELCSKCDEACVNSKNLVGRTALHIASLMGLVKAADVLLKHGAKVLATVHRKVLFVDSVYSIMGSASQIKTTSWLTAA